MPRLFLTFFSTLFLLTYFSTLFLTVFVQYNSSDSSVTHIRSFLLLHSTGAVLGGLLGGLAQPGAADFGDRRHMLCHGNVLPSDDREEGIWTPSRFKFSCRGLMRSATISRFSKRSFAIVGETIPDPTPVGPQVCYPRMG